jgi:hypothetical protein
VHGAGGGDEALTEGLTTALVELWTAAVAGSMLAEVEGEVALEVTGWDELAGAELAVVLG